LIPADSFDAFLLDLDGVVWRGETPVQRAAETIRTLREQGKRVVFITNNSARTSREYAIKLFRMKVPTETQDIVTSGHAVISELRRMGLVEGDRVHVCGSEGLIRLITHERLIPTNETDDVAAVVVGWNPRGTFEDIRRAATLARSGVPLIASNADPTYPGEVELLPGTGALLAAIETASGVKAKVVGKPRPELFQLALERAGTDPARTLVCGDRASTDIAGARTAGLPSALVLTGVTAESDLAQLTDMPDEILDDLSDLLRDLPRGTSSSEDGAAAIQTERDGETLHVRGFTIPPNADHRSAWVVLRRLLVEACAGAGRVQAPDELEPYLARIGFDAARQPRLFGG